MQMLLSVKTKDADKPMNPTGATVRTNKNRQKLNVEYPLGSC